MNGSQKFTNEDQDNPKCKIFNLKIKLKKKVKNKLIWASK